MEGKAAMGSLGIAGIFLGIILFGVAAFTPAKPGSSAERRRMWAGNLAFLALVAGIVFLFIAAH